MTILNRQTPNVMLGPKQVDRVMYGNYQVWPDVASGAVFLGAAPATGTDLKSWVPQDTPGGSAPATDPNTYWNVDPALGSPVIMWEWVNNKDGSRTILNGGGGSMTIKPVVGNAAYPITEIRIKGSGAPGQVSGITVEVDVDPGLAGSGSYQFTGNGPFVNGIGHTLMTPPTQRKTGDTYFFQAGSAMPIYIQEEYFYTSGGPLAFPSPMKDHYFADYGKMYCVLVVRPNDQQLFEWPHNTALVGRGGLVLGDQAGYPVHPIDVYSRFGGGAMVDSYNKFFFGTSNGPMLKFTYSGTPPQGWPTGGGDNLFELMAWA